MALIKCINCGHMISDKAVKCPKCGTPIQMIKEAAKPIEKEEKVIAEVETPKAIAKSEAVVPDEPKSQTWKKVCGIFVFAVIVIVGGYYYIQNEKSNSKSEEEIAQLNSEAFLEDGEYCYKGKWESARHAAQPCKVEFIIKNGALIDCAYTNLKFDVRIPLKGTIEDNNLHFVSESDGKLIIELKVCDNGIMLIGDGTDYAHSGDKARLNLSKIELDTVDNEQMDAGKANSYLSIKDFLSIEKEGKGSYAEEMFKQSGYEKLASKDGCDYWGKNVKVCQREVGHGGGYSSVDYVAEDTSKGSLIVISCGNNDKIAGFDVEVYEKEAFEKWKSQFLELGYKIEKIDNERIDGSWVDVMYFNKGNEEYTKETEYGVETVRPNEYKLYKMSDHEYILFAH